MQEMEEEIFFNHPIRVEVHIRRNQKPIYMEKITVNPRLEVLIVLARKTSFWVLFLKSSGLLEKAVRIEISYYLNRLEKATTKFGLQCIAKKKTKKNEL